MLRSSSTLEVDYSEVRAWTSSQRSLRIGRRSAEAFSTVLSTIVRRCGGPMQLVLQFVGLQIVWQRGSDDLVGLPEIGSEPVRGAVSNSGYVARNHP